MIWVICGYCVLSASLSILSLVLVFRGMITLEASQQTYFKRAGMLPYLSSIIIIALLLAGAFLLFKLRKGAIGVFGSLLAFTVLNDVARLVMSDTTKLYRGVALALAAQLFGWLLVASALLYAVRLNQRGVLT
jgi:hypothetical protein